MKPGEPIQIKATVLRVDGTRLDAQTPNGELIQTHISNVVEKSIRPGENKAVQNSPENKSRNK